MNIRELHFELWEKLRSVLKELESLHGGLKLAQRKIVSQEVTQVMPKKGFKKHLFSDYM